MAHANPLTIDTTLSAQPDTKALEVLRLVSPVLVISYYTIGTIVDLLAAPNSSISSEIRSSKVSGSKTQSPSRLGTLTLSLGVAITFVIQAFLIAWSPFSTHAGNGLGFALFSALMWLVLYLGLLDLALAAPAPLYGAWTLSLLLEIPLDTLQVISHPLTGIQVPALVISIIRLCFIALLVSLATLSRLHRHQNFCDEENEPLLTTATQYGSVSRAGNTRAGTATYDSESPKGSGQRTEEATDLGENDIWLEPERDPSKGWLAYLSAFSVFLPFLWPTNRPLLQVNTAGVGVCILASRFITVSVPIQLGRVVNILTERHDYIPWSEIGVFVLLRFLNSAAGIDLLRQFLWLPIESNSHKALATASFNHLMDLSCDFHDHKKSGTIWRSIDRGQSIIRLADLFLFQLVPEVIDLVVALTVLYWFFDVYMSLIVCTVIFVFLRSTKQMMAKKAVAQRDYGKKLVEEYEALTESTLNWQTVSYFNRVEYEKRRYAFTVQATRKSSWYYSVLSNFQQGCQTLVLLFGLLAACYLAAYQVAFQNRKVGDFVMLLTYWGSLSSPLHYLASGFSRVAESLIDAEQLLKLFQRRPAVADRANAAALHLDRGDVEFCGVGFSYDGRREVLKDTSFLASSGQTIALVGESGGGKSTILKLLFRFYDVTRGCVKIDGQDIRDVKLESLRANIGVVPQDPALFNKSVMENVRYGRLDASDEDVFKACKAVSLHDKITSFTDGYNSLVGERGVRLSGGELQRLAIARAIIKDPRIVLLDEATSSVDTETERQIQESFSKLCKGRTTFVIAHRLSTIINADQILVIRNGEIIERGTHRSLLQLKCHYHSLWSKQVSDSRSERSKSRSRSPAKGGITMLVHDLGSLSIPHPLMSARRRVHGPEDGHIHTDSNVAKETYSSSAPTTPHVGKQYFLGVSTRNVDDSKSLKKKMWKPDAPEFVPRNSEPTTSLSESLSQSPMPFKVATQDHHRGAGASQSAVRRSSQASNSKGNKENELGMRAVHASMIGAASQSLPDESNLSTTLRSIKRRQDTKDSSLWSSTEAMRPKDQTNTSATIANGDMDERKDSKKRKVNRRKLSKSEPPRHSNGQTDGTDDSGLTPLASSVFPATRGAPRRLTAPSDPPSGQGADVIGRGKRYRRKPAYWRSNTRSTNATGSSNGVTVTESSRQQPKAPTSSPAVEVTSLMNTQSNGVTFAPGV